MTYDDSASQTLGTAAILALSQGLPTFIGHPVAAAISFIAGNRVFSPTFRSISLNQWVVHDCNLTARQLRQAIRKVYQNQGRALYDFYHNLDRPEQIQKFVKLTPRFEKMMHECMSGELEQGTLMLMPHLSGFNLSGLYLAHLGFKFLTLAIPNPNKGYAWQNKLRNDRGMEVVPMNMETMQHARQRLQRGGTVLTGIDRPIDESNREPQFFGRKTALPVAYVKLALKTNARVFVIGFQTRKDNSIVVDVSPQVEFQKSEETHEELVLNAEKVLKIAEQFIRLDPSQWMMFLPVWPEVKKEVPTI
jgi:phosphatidylinositol dimannoside acyltransferase